MREELTQRGAPAEDSTWNWNALGAGTRFVGGSGDLDVEPVWDRRRDGIGSASLRVLRIFSDFRSCGMEVF